MVRVAVIGLGWWGKTIISTLQGSSAVTVVAAADLNPQSAEFAASKGVRFVPDLTAALAQPEVDAVVLCTPHTQHHRQILQSVAARKHVFCEKPLCLTRADATEAVAACRDAGLVLGVGHEKRFEPPILAIREMVRSGDLGTVLQIEANFSQNKFLALDSSNWRLSAAEAPAGPMTATGIHLVDLACSFLGEPDSALASVSTLGSNLVNGDTLGALIRFKSGANALITAILATPFDGRFAVYGNNGWADMRDNAHPEASEGWTLTTCTKDGKRSVKTFPPAPAVRHNIEAFAAAVAGRAPYPMTDAEKINTVATLEAIVRSSKERQAVPVLA